MSPEWAKVHSSICYAEKEPQLSHIAFNAVCCPIIALCGKLCLILLILGTEIIYQYDFMYNTGVRVHLIDTPGFDDTGKTETEVLKDLLRFLHELQIDKIKLSGILCLHNLAVSLAIRP